MALVTITMGLGSGDIGIAQQVADRLNVKLYDDHGLKEAALHMGIRSWDLGSLDEKAPGFFDQILSRRPELYRDFMEAVVFEVAQNGKGIIIGHGSQILLRDFGCALHVHLHAPEPARIENLTRQCVLSRDAAEKLIHKKDNEQRGFFRYAFNMRMSDPSLYDLIINTEKLGTDLTVDLIVESARSDEIKTCSLEAVDTMERMSQTRKIRAALIDNGITVSMLHIEVPRKNAAAVRGFTHTQEEIDRIEEIVGALSGASELNTDISVMPSSGD
jgi:cytidylate kinase